MVVGNFLTAGERVSCAGEKTPLVFKSTCILLPSIQRSPKAAKGYSKTLEYEYRVKTVALDTLK
jgi:hypothetical protein